MIRLTEGLWIGHAGDMRNVAAVQIEAVLCVAQDLCGAVGWPEVEYAQVGLIDGPGNPPAAYVAAVLALATLLKRHDRVLVCCHEGGRSLATAMIYLNATSPRGWDWWQALLRERCDIDLPVPHAAHRAAFDHMNWRLLTSLIGEE